MKPLVSVLIPAYNSGRWIGQTLASAVAQTWTRAEIIVVDDGSSDETLAVAQMFSSASVAVLTQENQGAAAARNSALKLCQGDYIQWLDADDLLAPDKISKQMEDAVKIINKRVLLSSAFGSFVHRTSKAKFQPTPLWADLDPTEWLVRKMGQNLFMQTATWLVTRELTEAAGPWDVRLSLDDDGEYFCRVLLASKGVHFVDDAKVFYRSAGLNALHIVGRSNRKLESQFLSMQLHVKYLCSMENSERTRSACVKYLQNWFGNFIGTRPDIVARLEALAVTLGGRLEAPHLGGNYVYIEKVFGYANARRSRQFLRDFKWLLMALWDRTMFYLESFDPTRNEVGGKGARTVAQYDADCSEPKMQ